MNRAYAASTTLIACAMCMIVLSGCDQTKENDMEPNRMFRDAANRQIAESIAGENGKNLEELIVRSNDINECGRDGTTLLMFALRKKNKAAFEVLLEQGADPNILTDDGSSVMHEASRRADATWLQGALRHGGNPNLLNMGNRFFPNETPIYAAIAAEHPKNVRLLIDAGATLSHRCDRIGATPVFAAARSGNYEMVNDMLDAGADFELTDNNNKNLIDWLNERTVDLIRIDQREQFRLTLEKLKDHLKPRSQPNQ